MASRTHIVNGFEPVGSVQTQRDHCGRGGWRSKARGQALSAHVVGLLPEKFDHDLAKLQHGAPVSCVAHDAKDAPDSRSG